MRGAAEVGVMRSGRDGRGHSVTALEALGGPLLCGGSELQSRIPAWMTLPQPAMT